MYYSYIEIEYVAASFSPARTDLALKLLTLLGDPIRSIPQLWNQPIIWVGTHHVIVFGKKD